MEFTLLPTNNIINNLPEVFNFLTMECSNNFDKLNKINDLYCDVFYSNEISYNKDDINIEKYNYKVTKEYKDDFIINTSVINCIDNVKLFRFYFPLPEFNYYLGSIYIYKKISKDEQNKFNVVTAPDNFI